MPSYKQKAKKKLQAVKKELKDFKHMMIGDKMGAQIIELKMTLNETLELKKVIEAKSNREIEQLKKMLKHANISAHETIANASLGLGSVGGGTCLLPRSTKYTCDLVLMLMSHVLSMTNRTALDTNC